MKQLKISERITQRSSNIDRYFNDVGSYTSLTADEEYELAVRIKQGDEAALEKMIRYNLRFVISVAKQYAVQPEILSELIAQGNIGLIDAARTFDPTRGFKFISYAVWHIRKEILQYFNDSHKTVRVPANVTLDLNRARKVESALSTELGRDATLEEIVAKMSELGWETNVKKLERGRILAEGTVHFEASNPDEEWAPVNWVQSESQASEVLDKKEKTKTILRILDQLSPVERDVVILHLGLINDIPVSFREISERHDRTSEWARQKYKKAIRKIKSWARRNGVEWPG